MKLLLLRKENSRSGRCLLSYRNRPWVRLFENPSHRHLLPDGLYRLVWDHEEVKGWYLQLVNGNGKRIGRIFPSTLEEKLSPGDFSPVEHFGNGNKFSRLAFMRLVDRLKESGEEDWHFEVATVNILSIKR